VSIEVLINKETSKLVLLVGINITNGTYDIQDGKPGRFTRIKIHPSSNILDVIRKEYLPLGSL
jgi:hypothetical protein